MGESTKAADAVDKLVRAVGGKFTGLKYDVWKRTAESVISIRHSGISDILEGRPCPEPDYIHPYPSSTTRRPSRAVTRSQAVDESTQHTTGETSPVGTPSGTGATRHADAGASSPHLYGLRMTTSPISKIPKSGTVTIDFFTTSCF